MFGCGVQAIFTGTAYSYDEVKKAVRTDVETTFSQLHQLGAQVHLHYLSRDRRWSFGHSEEFLLEFRSARVAERVS